VDFYKDSKYASGPFIIRRSRFWNIKRRFEGKLGRKRELLIYLGSLIHGLCPPRRSRHACKNYRKVEESQA
jgi:hypothetical protein